MAIMCLILERIQPKKISMKFTQAPTQRYASTLRKSLILMEVGKFPKCNLLLVVSKCAEQVCISWIAAKTSLAGIKTTFSLQHF